MKATLQNFKPTADKIFVTDLERGMAKTAGGIILKDDVGTDKGIRPRWGRVIMTGPGVEDVKVGDWVFIESGRWSVGFDMIDETTGQPVKVWHIDNKGMIAVSDIDPRLTEYRN